MISKKKLWGDPLSSQGAGKAFLSDEKEKPIQKGARGGVGPPQLVLLSDLQSGPQHRLGNGDRPQDTLRQMELAPPLLPLRGVSKKILPLTVCSHHSTVLSNPFMREKLPEQKSFSCVSVLEKCRSQTKKKVRNRPPQPQSRTESHST